MFGREPPSATGKVRCAVYLVAFALDVASDRIFVGRELGEFVSKTLYISIAVHRIPPAVLMPTTSWLFIRLLATRNFLARLAVQISPEVSRFSHRLKGHAVFN